MAVYFIGDPHFGHRNIHKLRDCVTSSEANTQFIVAHWRRFITKRDLVYVMGDVAFDDESLKIYSTLPGRKILVRGNHDRDFTTAQLSEHFEEIHGMVKYKGLWLTHCPMHPQELFGRVNLHGHVHNNTVMRGGVIDDRYINVCVEEIWRLYGRVFLPLEEAKERAEKSQMAIDFRKEQEELRHKRFIGTPNLGIAFQKAA